MTLHERLGVYRLHYRYHRYQISGAAAAGSASLVHVEIVKEISTLNHYNNEAWEDDTRLNTETLSEGSGQCIAHIHYK